MKDKDGKRGAVDRLGAGELENGKLAGRCTELLDRTGPVTGDDG